ncbi:hypothetical protein [Fodinibius sediminis]|uniref:hypothetical protein n=1 Tax=Fodinibius sediminis TaxID=1214077 RepID=UPI00163D5919|nr:hypothetical protein [Fodinibius sediminis]
MEELDSVSKEDRAAFRSHYRYIHQRVEKNVVKINTGQRQVLPAPLKRIDR